MCRTPTAAASNAGCPASSHCAAASVLSGCASGAAGCCETGGTAPTGGPLPFFYFTWKNIIQASQGNQFIAHLLAGAYLHLAPLHGLPGVAPLLIVPQHIDGRIGVQGVVGPPVDKNRAVGACASHAEAVIEAHRRLDPSPQLLLHVVDVDVVEHSFLYALLLVVGLIVFAPTI